MTGLRTRKPHTRFTRWQQEPSLNLDCSCLSL
jgi:hypothetical protein